MKLNTLIICVLFSMKMAQGQDSIPKPIDPTDHRQMLREITPNYYDRPQQVPAPKRPVNQDLYLPLLPFALKSPPIIHKPAHYQTPKTQPKPQNLIHIGLGSYLTPRMDVHWMPKNQKISLQTSHYQGFTGAKDGQNSASINTHLGAFGDYVKWGKKIGFEVSGRHRILHFYGYDAPAETIKPMDIRQTFNSLETQFYILKADYGSKLNYKTRLKSWFWRDNFGIMESGLNPSFQLAYDLENRQKVNFNFNGQSLFSSDSINYSLHTYSVGVNYTKNTAQFRGKIGAKIGVDLTPEEAKVLIFPDVSLEYDILPEKLTTFIQAEGQIRPVSKRQLTLENPFLQTDFRVRNQYETQSTRLGVRGNLIPFFNFDFAFFYGREANFYVFQNDENEPDKFIVSVDTETIQKYGVDAYFSYQPKKVKTELHAKWTKYQMNTLAKAWHLPERELTASLVYQHQKFNPSLSIEYAGKIPFYDLKTQSTQFLPDRTNIRLEGKYMLKKNNHIYLKINNLINKKYYHFYRYRALGIEAIVGGSFWF